MPSFEFQGFTETVYPDTRDVNGRNLGIVQPGDIRMFDDAPDWLWVPVIPPGTSETSGSEDEPPAGQEAAAAVEAVPESVPAADPGPVPAPPAVSPAGPAFAITADQQ